MQQDLHEVGLANNQVAHLLCHAGPVLCLSEFKIGSEALTRLLLAVQFVLASEELLNLLGVEHHERVWHEAIRLVVLQLALRVGAEGDLALDSLDRGERWCVVLALSGV